MPVGPFTALPPGGGGTRMEDVPAPGSTPSALPPAVGMTDDEIAALCRDGVAA